MARIHKLQEREIARNARLWMGIDAHKDSWAITIVDGERIVHQGSCESKREHLESLVRGCRPVRLRLSTKRAPRATSS